MEYLFVKWIHILSSMLLFGTGIGSAFYLFFVSRTRDVRAIAAVARHVVIADLLFTAPTAVIQPLSGWYMMRLAGFSWDAAWLRWSAVLYAFAIFCWLPVVWIQTRMRDLALAARDQNLPRVGDLYYRYLLSWSVLGFAALFAFLMIIYLMVAKVP